jgi:hypothetical protein
MNSFHFYVRNAIDKNETKDVVYLLNQDNPEILGF